MPPFGVSSFFILLVIFTRFRIFLHSHALFFGLVSFPLCSIILPVSACFLSLEFASPTADHVFFAPYGPACSGFTSGGTSGSFPDYNDFRGV